MIGLHILNTYIYNMVMKWYVICNIKVSPPIILSIISPASGSSKMANFPPEDCDCLFPKSNLLIPKITMSYCVINNRMNFDVTTLSETSFDLPTKIFKRFVK